MSELTTLVRKIDRKLDIGRGLNFTHAELNVLVSTGAYGALQTAARIEREEQCRKVKHQGPRVAA